MKSATLSKPKESKKAAHTFEVKAVKTFKGHEGMQGFNCDLYIDGKKACEITDDCHGGEFEYRWQTNEMARAGFSILQEHCKTLGKYKDPNPHADLAGFELDYSPDLFIGELVDKILTAKMNASQHRKFLKVLSVKLPSKHPPGEYATWKIPPTAENKAKVKAQFPDAIFLDEHPNDWYEICQRGKK